MTLRVRDLENGLDSRVQMIGKPVQQRCVFQGLIAQELQELGRMGRRDDLNASPPGLMLDQINKKTESGRVNAVLHLLNEVE